MPLDYLHNHPDFKDLLRTVGQKKNIENSLIEKDYFLMHCLYGLKKQGFDFELKGGTSLSKAYKIIHRFSEDIDIRINPPRDLDLKIGKNHDEEKHCLARRDYYDALATQIKINGIVKAERDVRFDDKPRYRNGGIRLAYETSFDQIDGLKEGILLEVGFDKVTPNKPFMISSWAVDFAEEHKLEVIDNKVYEVKCYDPGFTLVEKLQTIITKYRQFLEGQGAPPNFMRHYYDVYCLLGNVEVQKFIGTPEYKQHIETKIRGIDRETPVPEHPALLLKDKKIRKQFENEYRSKASLYYQGQPAFDDILKKISENLPNL